MFLDGLDNGFVVTTTGDTLEELMVEDTATGTEEDTRSSAQERLGLTDM